MGACPSSPARRWTLAVTSQHRDVQASIWVLGDTRITDLPYFQLPGECVSTSTTAIGHGDPFRGGPLAPRRESRGRLYSRRREARIETAEGNPLER